MEHKVCFAVLVPRTSADAEQAVFGVCAKGQGFSLHKLEVEVLIVIWNRLITIFVIDSLCQLIMIFLDVYTKHFTAACIGKGS